MLTPELGLRTNSYYLKVPYTSCDVDKSKRSHEMPDHKGAGNPSSKTSKPRINRRNPQSSVPVSPLVG